MPSNLADTVLITSRLSCRVLIPPSFFFRFLASPLFPLSFPDSLLRVVTLRQFESVIVYPRAEITEVCVCSLLRKCVRLFSSGGQCLLIGNVRNKSTAHEETERGFERRGCHVKTLTWVSCEDTVF